MATRTIYAYSSNSVYCTYSLSISRSNTSVTVKVSGTIYGNGSSSDSDGKLYAHVCYGVSPANTGSDTTYVSDYGTKFGTGKLVVDSPLNSSTIPKSGKSFSASWTFTQAAAKTYSNCALFLSSSSSDPSDKSGSAYRFVGKRDSDINASYPRYYTESLSVKAASITLTFYGNGATGVGSSTSATAYNPTSNLTQTISYSSNYTNYDIYSVGSLFKRTGYHIAETAKSWRVGSATATTYMSGGTVDLTDYLEAGKSLNLYANWTANSYSIAYNANGGSGSMSATPATYGSNVTLRTNSFTRTGYNFLGWSTSSTATSATYSDKDSVKNLTSTKGGTVTLYAVWSIKTLTIYFYRNSSSSDTTYTTKKYTYGNEGESGQNFLAPTWTRTGYHATKWAANADGSGTTWTLENAVTDSRINSSSPTLKVYLVWAVNSYTIKYSANNGSGTMSNTSATYGKSVTLRTNTFTRTGYNFLGWSTSSTATSATYEDGESVSNLTSTNGGSVTLYAVWKLNYVRIAYHPNGGTVDSTAYTTNSSGYLYSVSKETPYFHTINYGVNDDPYNLSTFGLSRPGYTFKGWKVKSSGTVLDMDTLYASTTYCDNDDTSLTTANTPLVTCFLVAQWQVNYFYVRYNANGGTQASGNSYTMPYSAKVTYGSNYKLLHHTAFGLSRRGYHIVESGGYSRSWNTKADGSGLNLEVEPAGSSIEGQTLANLVGYDLSTKTGGTVDLYASWILNILTITYNANGGTQGSEASKTLPYTSILYYGKSYDLWDYAGTFDLTRPYYHILSNDKAWNTKSNGSGVSYDQNTTISAEEIANKAGLDLSKGNQSLTLYANWTSNTLTIKYDVNGAYQDIYKQFDSGHQQTTLYSTSGDILRRIYQFDCFKFAHSINDGEEWNTKADGSGVSFDHNGSYSMTEIAEACGLDLSSNSRTVTLYANWCPRAVIAYDMNTNYKGNLNLFCPIRDWRTGSNILINGVYVYKNPSYNGRIAISGTSSQEDLSTGWIGQRIFSEMPVDIEDTDTSLCLTATHKGGSFTSNPTGARGLLLVDIVELSDLSYPSTGQIQFYVYLDTLISEGQVVLHKDISTLPAGRYGIRAAFWLNSEYRVGSVYDDLQIDLKVEKGSESTEYFPSYQIITEDKSTYTLTIPAYIDETELIGRTNTGWNTKPDGSGVEYLAGDKVPALYGKTSALYAQWEYDTKIKVNSNKKYRHAIAYVYKNGKWRQCLPYVRHNNKWNS